MTVEIANQLRAAKARVDTPAKWAPGVPGMVLALNRDWNPVDPESATAKCWSLQWSVWKETGLDRDATVALMGTAMGGEHIDQFEQGKTHLDVMAALDVAIAEQEA